MSQLTPLKAIRKHCLECASGYKNVETCTSINCTLYPFRMGKRPPNPNAKPRKPRPPMSAEHKTALLAGLAKAREAKKAAKLNNDRVGMIADTFMATPAEVNEWNKNNQ